MRCSGARLRRWATTLMALVVAASLTSLVQLATAPPAAAGTTPVTMAAGWTHTCTIRSGKAYCWGDNTYGELGNNSTVSSTVPVPVYTGGALSGVTLTQISAGNGYTCALSSGGAAYCWGANQYGELGINSSMAASDVPVAVSTAGALAGKTISQISAGEYHACAVASSAAYCWGWNYWGMLGNNSTVNSTAPVAVYTGGALSGKSVTSIAAGYAHTCAVASGAAYCWGANGAGQLGNTGGNSLVPVAVSTSGVLSGVTVSAVTSGWEHSCVLSSTNVAYCWGHGSSGELGNNLGTNSNVPVAVYTAGALSGLTVTQIDAGYADTCVIASNNLGYCWGHGGAGELGNNSSSQQNAPSAVYASTLLSGKTLSQISAGQYHTCAVDSSGGTYCWGTDTGGQLGDPATGVTNYIPIPVLAPQSTTVTGGYSHSCEINPNGAAYCWGDQTNGGLGNNATASANKQTPVAVYATGALSGVTLTQISAGQQYTCALSTAGKAYCWGYNAYGQLGNNTGAPGTTSGVPVAVYTGGVLSGVTLIQIAAGNSFVCALATTGKAYCWGYDGEGDLGNGGTTNSGVPVAVSQGSVLYSDVAAGVDHGCALTPAGAAYCWGFNQYGELGISGNTTEQNSPQAVTTSGTPLSGVSLTEIAAGNYFTCALSSAGAGYCWGYNIDGQLGNNATSTSAQTTAVAMYTSGALSGVTLTQITAGQYHACALSTAGAGYCWGQDNAGQLGNGTPNSNSSVAVAVTTSGVLAGATLTQISSSWQHTCGMDNSYTMDCWGLNGNGQLGNNSVTSSSVPVTVVSLAPGEPVGVVAVPAAASMTVYFTGPSDDGYGTLTNYTATATPGGGDGAPASGSCTTSGAATSCTITGLTNGGVYMVTVTTNTSAGGSAASLPASAAVWPWTAAIAAGYTHACAISGGKAYCWGDDTYGELGNNTTTTTPQTTPVAVYTGGALSGVTLTQITAGNDFTCALSSAGAVYCWGLGTSGQLGNNASSTSSVPVAVYTGGALSGVTVTDIGAGNLHACALGSNGAAYCWGYNGFGELGNSSNSQSQVPVAVTTSGALSGVSLVGLTGGGNNFMCAQSSTGQAYCWGYGSNGQLGNNSSSSSNVPVAVTTSGALYGTALAILTIGFDHTCALSLSGAAYCWGDNGGGELGNNGTSPSSVPVAAYTGGLLSGITLQQISGGELFTCVQDTTPYDYCWGANGSGQLGNNSTNQSTVAVYVAPQAPTGLGATMGASTAAVSWTAPAFTNSGTITGYTATAAPGNLTCTTTGATSCTISGLTGAVTYTITVTVTASPTGSATSSSITGTTTALQMAAPASLTWSAADTGYNLAVVDQASGDQQLTVTDTTGTNAGWHVTVSATTLTTGTYTVPNAGALVLTGSTSSSASSSAPSTACVGSCTLPTDTTTYPVSITTAASSPASYTVYDTAANTGMGQITIGGSASANPVGWWVVAPGDARAGTYTTTLTVQLISGP
jgi:alpha-tubulin suppressor-like RCC1 family protein